MWFRRDLRLTDNPALLAAVEAARADGDGRVVPLFVVDPALLAAGRGRATGLPRVVAAGPGRQPRRRAAPPARRSGRGAARGGPSRRRDQRAPRGRLRSVRTDRDAAVEAALDVPLVRTGSPYAVAPGRVTKDDGTPYRVYTPFWRAWIRHGWPPPAPHPGAVDWWTPMECDGYPAAPDLGDLALPPAGEDAAWDRWEEYRASGLASYAERRNRPDVAGTSAMSHHLKWGEIHPRSLLADLGPDDEVFGKELAWREFYADVLAQDPASARVSLDRPLRRGHALADRSGGRRALRGLALGPDRLSARRRRDAAAARPRAGSTTASGWSWRASWSRTCTCPGSAARRSSCTGCATPTSPATRTAGSGPPAAEPTRRPSTGCSTRCCRA